MQRNNYILNVNRKDCCPAQGALHPLLPTPGYEEVLVTGKGEQLQSPGMWKGPQLSAARRPAERGSDDGKRPAR